MSESGKINSANEERSCPKCGALNLVSARFCTRCGKLLVQETRTNTIICSKCSTENPSYASFCMECGTELKITDLEKRKEHYLQDKMESLELTPAESLIIMDLDADGKEMFKLTMLDLLARRVIKMQTFQEDKGFSVKKPALFHEVQRGEEFETRLQPFEEIFRKPLYSYDEIEVFQYIKKVLKNISPILANSFSEYKEFYLMDPLIKEGYIEKVEKHGIKSHDHYQLTEYGQNVRKRINDLLDEADYIGEWVDTDPERAKAFLSAIGSHVFILNYDLDTLRFLKNTLGGVKSRTSDFYTYYLFPLYFVEGIKSEKIGDLFGMDALKSFEYFETFDAFDDIFDAFDSE
ncbi:MAG: zinc-ribbon domain-containing protein [Methanobacteriaceae archaeon]|nr:zinc-ribbon domain-containing protein [Methanobacteriaceae archaeon]